MPPCHCQLSQQRRRPLHSLAEAPIAPAAKTRPAVVVVAVPPSCKAPPHAQCHAVWDDEEGSKVGWEGSTCATAVSNEDAARTRKGLWSAAVAAPPPQPFMQHVLTDAHGDVCEGLKRNREEEAATSPLQRDVRGSRKEASMYVRSFAVPIAAVEVPRAATATSVWPWGRGKMMLSPKEENGPLHPARRGFGLSSLQGFTTPQGFPGGDEEDAAEEAVLFCASSSSSSEEGGAEEARGAGTTLLSRSAPKPRGRVSWSRRHACDPSTWTRRQRDRRGRHEDVASLVRDAAAMTRALWPRDLFPTHDACFALMTTVALTRFESVAAGVADHVRSWRLGIVALTEYTQLCMAQRREIAARGSLADVVCTSLAYYAAHVD